MSLKAAYNGYMLTDYFVLSNLKRPLPDFRAVSTEINGRHGESFDDATIGTREVSFQLVFKQTSKYTIQDAARTLADMLATRTPQSLIFSDGKTRENKQLVRYAVPIGAFDAEEFIRAGRWTCRFVQHDPFLYYDSDAT
jgi:predicted phage tail component-like protein